MTDREREACERLRAYIDGLEVYVGTGRAFRPDVHAVLAALEAAEEKAKYYEFAYSYGSPFDPTGVKRGTEILALREKVAAMEPVVARLAAALEWAFKFGREFNHLPGCMEQAPGYLTTRKCDCGYDDVSFGSIAATLSEYRATQIAVDGPEGA